MEQCDGPAIAIHSANVETKIHFATRANNLVKSEKSIQHSEAENRLNK